MMTGPIEPLITRRVSQGFNEQQSRALLATLLDTCARPDNLAAALCHEQFTTERGAYRFIGHLTHPPTRRPDHDHHHHQPQPRRGHPRRWHRTRRRHRPILKSHGFRWFRTLGQWGVPKSRDRLPNEHTIQAAAAALRAAGHDIELDIDRSHRDTATVEAEKAARATDRAAALATKAERRSNEAHSAAQAHDRAAEALPYGGEPIKIGHHSERRNPARGPARRTTCHHRQQRHRTPSQPSHCCQPHRQA